MLTAIISEKTSIDSLSILSPEILIRDNQSLEKLVELAKNDWILYLKGNEILLEVNELDLVNEEIYGVMILQDDIIVKETRLWNRKYNKLKFKNPIFENLNADPTKILDILIYQDKITYDVKKIDQWRQNNPLAIESYYYKAFIALGERKFTEFKSLISHYLFNSQKIDVAYVMARYYLAVVETAEKNAEAAIKNIILCLIENPIMAEFWCLLGDILVMSEKFEKAITFYENAMILGSKRLKLDMYPVHISKYETYPKDMTAKCKNLLTNSKNYLSDSQ